jgi:hypothetical protein
VGRGSDEGLTLVLRIALLGYHPLREGGVL